MLIGRDEIIKIINEYNLKITGALHIGAHDCEELYFYNSIGLDNSSLIWIEAINDKVTQAMHRGIPNVYNAIISDKDNEDITFNISNNGQSSSMLEFNTHAIEHPHVFYVNKIHGKTKTISTFFNENNLDSSKYNFWNFDIQGAELLALKGAGEHIKNASILYLEVNEKELYKNCGMINEIDEYVGKYGFKRVLTNMTHHGWGDAVYVKTN